MIHLYIILVIAFIKNIIQFTIKLVVLYYSKSITTNIKYQVPNRNSTFVYFIHLIVCGTIKIIIDINKYFRAI
jgi:hypothetical protein